MAKTIQKKTATSRYKRENDLHQKVKSLFYWIMIYESSVIASGRESWDMRALLCACTIIIQLLTDGLHLLQNLNKKWKVKKLQYITARPVKYTSVFHSILCYGKWKIPIHVITNMLDLFDASSHLSVTSCVL